MVTTHIQTTIYIKQVYNQYMYIYSKEEEKIDNKRDVGGYAPNITNRLSGVMPMKQILLR